jgi:hypothetical protein
MDILLPVCMPVGLSRLFRERRNHGAYIPPATTQSNGHKAYAPQSEIDTDIAVKGSCVLFDPNLDVLEQQRYRDAIEKRNNDSV